MKKRIVAVFFVAALMLALGVSSLASSPAPSTDISGMLGTAFTGMVADVLSAFGVIIPIAIGVFGALWAVKMGIKIFKTASGGGSVGT